MWIPITAINSIGTILVYWLKCTCRCQTRVWVTGMRLPSGDYLIVVAHDDSDQVMHDYSKRWKLEVFFQSL
ncbi:hypothetical protein C2W62_53295, partial [Candidatus Entotheonella serta]